MDTEQYNVLIEESIDLVFLMEQLKANRRLVTTVKESCNLHKPVITAGSCNLLKNCS